MNHGLQTLLNINYSAATIDFAWIKLAKNSPAAPVSFLGEKSVKVQKTQKCWRGQKMKWRNKGYLNIIKLWSWPKKENVPKNEEMCVALTNHTNIRKGFSLGKEIA